MLEHTVFIVRYPEVPRRGDTQVSELLQTHLNTELCCSQLSWMRVLPQNCFTELVKHDKFDFTDRKTTLNDLAVEENSSSLEMRNQNQLS